MFMVLSSWQSHCESSPGLFDECRMAPSGRRPKTKPDDLGCESPVQAARVYINHCDLLSLSPKADTHFTVPQRVEGWVDLAGWLHTEMVYPSTDAVTHPGTNRVWRSATTLIEANALPLSQTASYSYEHYEHFNYKFINSTSVISYELWTVSYNGATMTSYSFSSSITELLLLLLLL